MVKHKVQTVTIPYLDYEIVNTFTGDGYVLTKRKGKNYETHLGNYKSEASAKKAAVIYFMLARPQHFATTMYYRANGYGGQMHEFGLFKQVLADEGLAMPSEITSSVDMNAEIYFDGRALVDLKYGNL